MSPPRVAVGGLHTECSTYNPWLMQAADFRILRGAEIPAHPEFAMLPETAFEWCPTLHARATPGGPISRGAYEALKAEFLERLTACGPLDGLYLAMHGAAFVEGMQDAEGDWISAARAVVGPACPITASYDLHGNVSQRVLDQLDMFSAYRTAPHIDVEDTKRRAIAMLMRHLAGGPLPHLCRVAIPVLLPGERTSTEDSPARELYARLASCEGVDDVSIMVGYVWADEPRATACIVVTGTDAAAMAREAIALARAYWEVRHEFAFGSRAGGVEECLDWAAEAGTSPVIMADSGDNPTGGGVGERADVLAALLRRGVQDALVAGIADAPATEACFQAGEGAALRLSIGATLDPAGSVPVIADAVVVTLDADERQAVVRIGGVRVVLCARRRPYHMIADFARLGLDPRAVRLLVVKSGYLSPELAPIARPSLLALSAGVVDQDVAHLPPGLRARPMFPFDADFMFEPVLRVSGRAL